MNKHLTAASVFILLLFVLLCALPAAALEGQLNRFFEQNGPAWEIVPDARGDIVRRMWGQGIALDLRSDAVPGDVAAACDNLIERWGSLWGADRAQLGEPTIVRVHDLWFVRYDQQLNGVPVFGARLELRVHATGSVVLVRSDLIPGLSLAPDQPDVALNFERALEAAWDFCGIDAHSARISALAWPDRATQTAHWAWRIEARPGSGRTRPLCYIDDRDLDLIARRDLTNHAAVSGTVSANVHPLYGTQTPVELALAEQRVSLVGVGFDITDGSGDYSVEAGSGAVTLQAELDGPFLDVVDLGGASRITRATSAGDTEDLLWSDGNSSAAERDVFFHLTAARAFMKNLDTEFTGLDALLSAQTGAAGTCDAWWDGAGFYFTAAGGGCGDMGTFADVIYHEYGHAVTEQLGEEPDAFPDELLEAFSDYFACTITDDPQFGEYVQGTADPLRDIDQPDLVTPDDLTGDAEHDGMILSGALWDMRQNLIELLGPVAGQTLADDLFHFARYGLAQTFEDYMFDLWALDDDNGDLSDGSPHAYYIIEAFNRHGMGPQTGFDLLGATVQNDDNDNGTAEPGESIELVPTLSSRYKGTDELELTLSSDSEFVTVDSDSVTFPYVESWSEVTAGAGWQVSVSADAPFGTQIELEVEISTPDKSYSETEPLVLTVGSFQVLFVDDDGGQELEVYLNCGLLDSGYTFASWNVAGVEASPGLVDLGAYPVVVWNTGDQNENTLTAEDQTALAAYLEDGGALLMIGQGILNDIGATTFAAQYLHAASSELDTGATLLFPPENEPITAGMFFETLIYIYADEADVIVPGANANSLLLNHLSGANAIKFPQIGQEAYRMIFFSFSFEALPIEGTEPSTGPTLLARSLDWLLPLELIHSSPYDGQTDVLIDSEVTLRFTKPLDQESLELMINPDPGELSVSWSADSTEVTISHAEPFPGEGSEISVQVVSATDLLGNELQRGDTPNPFSFLTAGPPQPQTVAPDHGAADEPTEVLIQGAEFIETPQLALNDTPLEQVEFRSADVLTALVPEGLGQGTYDLIVTNPDGQSATLSNAFTVGQDDDSGDDDDDSGGCGCSMSAANGNSLSLSLMLYIALFLAAWLGLSRKQY
ncbi:MAG: Ig-like domain-containing protein [Candidatus Alcyoniella australis]|nr:Ig-like domain-containing protein [Candidatus Alcyoniella australis]